MRKLARTDGADYAGSDVVSLNPVDAPPQSVGGLLQTKRAEFGVELREAADYLNIRYAYLLAIEEGRVDDLPGAAYAMGFVRAYADYLGLDGPTIVERYKAETSELGDDVRLVFPSPLPEGKIPSGAIILVGIVALLLVYGGWVFFAQQDVKIAELVPALPKQFSSLLGSDEPAAEQARSPAEAEATAPATAEPAPIAAVAPPEPETPTPAPEIQIETRSDPTYSASVAASPVTTPPVADAPGEPAATETAPEPTAATSTQDATAPAANVDALAAATSEVAETAAQAAPVTEATVPSEPGPVVVETVDANSATVAGDATESASTAVTPVRAADAVQAVASNSEQSTPPTEQSTPPTTEQAETPSEAVGSAAVQESPEAATLPPSAPAVASAEPRQFGSENAVSRVTIKARIDSWVQIQDQEGDKLLTRVLRAGDSYRVPDRPGLLMETGNAGGLEITVDGSVIPDLGPKGAVRREIALEAESLKAGGSR